MKTWRIEITTQHVVEAETEMEAVQATNDQNCMEVVSHSVVQVEENSPAEPTPECDECGAVEGGRLDGCDYCGITHWFNGKVYHPRSMRYIGAETNGATCSSCNKVISEDDIIGDGTNRGVCCIPDYLED